MTAATDIVRCSTCGASNRIAPDKLARDLQPVCGQCGGALNAAAAGPIHVTDGSFDRDVLQADVPVLVDLWAPWCGPCRMIAPTLDAIAREMAGRLRVAKVNVDENPGTADELGVRGIPTLVVFKGGREIDRIVGALPKPALLRRLEAVA